MKEIEKKRINLIRRKNRIKNSIKNTNLNRLSVYISNNNVFAQIIDDQKGITLVSSHSLKIDPTNNLTQKAGLVGKDIAKKAIDGKIKKVVFDRNGKMYHGRIKEFVDQARSTGLEI